MESSESQVLNGTCKVSVIECSQDVLIALGPDSDAISVIYKKQDARPLTDYQKQINEGGQNICEQNPTMLRSREELLDAA